MQLTARPGRYAWLGAAALVTAVLVLAVPAVPREPARHAQTTSASPPADVPQPPLRPLTAGPRFHWFGYYDKLQFDPTDRYVLGMAVDFEHREVTADDVVEIGMVDLQSHQTWVTLGHSRAWNWQQGCSLQWLSGSRDSVIWNDREGEGPRARFVSRILELSTGRERTLLHPIYTIAPNGKTALSLDFSRLARGRPGYGYPGLDDPTLAKPVRTVDLQLGIAALIVSLADITAFGRDRLGARRWPSDVPARPRRTDRRRAPWGDLTVAA